jgi:hypothetical protein
VITEVPGITPVVTPDVMPTVAMLVALLLHVPPAVVLLNVVVLPAHTVVVPTIEEGKLMVMVVVVAQPAGVV